MKIRCVPEDFVVNEVTQLVPSAGRYGLYRLRKRSIGTSEAIEHIRRSWNLESRQIEHAGLKDRHAVTTQFITIRNGPRAGFTADGIELEYLDQADRAITAADIAANEFRIVLRNLTAEDAASVMTNVDSLRAGGVPNYFDEQRFGSLGASKKFVAAEQCLKNYEQALWLALAEHNSHDDADERGEKRILRNHWGDWTMCKQTLARSHRRSIVTYLVDHPDNFRKAFALLRPQLRGLYLSALQSAVWNRMLAALIQQQGLVCSRLILIGDAELPFPESIPPGLIDLPLPSARCKGLTPELRNLADAASANYGLKPADMKVAFPRDRFFSRGSRSTVLRPYDLAAAAGKDELNPLRKSVTLSFALPRGCYATMIVKAVTPAATSQKNSRQR